MISTMILAQVVCELAMAILVEGFTNEDCGGDACRGDICRNGNDSRQQQ